jgi:hypothetical protein
MLDALAERKGRNERNRNVRRRRCGVGLGVIAFSLQRYLDAVTIHDGFSEALLEEIPVRRISLLIEGGAHRSNDELFDVRSGNASDSSGLALSSLKQRMRDIVAIAYASLVGVRGRHRVAPVVEHFANEKRRRRSPNF